MISCATVMEAWQRALREIKTTGSTFVDNEERSCREVLNLVVTVETLDDVRVPLQWIRANGDWTYPSDVELHDMLFSRAGEESGYAYGSRIFAYESRLDQLEGYVIPLLRRQPNSRRALIVLADPLADGKASRNYISLLSLWFRVVNGRLDVTATLRSNDFLIGWPANIYQVSLLQLHIAERLGLQPGSITTISHSAHYFADEEALVEKLLKRK